MTRRHLWTSLLLATLAGTAGCPVGQRPGEGEVMHLQEPRTGGAYYLYLPADYVQDSPTLTGKQWPLVVTFHGMKPFDNAGSQIREWQQEADRYGYVVIAPECSAPNLLSEFPIRRVHKGVLRDEALTMGAMDDVARRVDIDPAQVLSTSWSSGGYLAHYMANRHPERFTCIAPRQSNFSADILDPAMVDRYRQTKVGIFYTQNDFKICQRESQEGARWYSEKGFDVTFAVFKDLGHQRRPSVAADFFASQIDADAKTPPLELARMQVRTLPLPEPAAGENRLAANRTANRTAKRDRDEPSPEPRESISERTPRRDEVSTVSMPSSASIAPDALASAPATTAIKKRRPVAAAEDGYGGRTRVDPRDRPTPLRGTLPQSIPGVYRTKDDAPLRVQVSSTMGIAPMHVSFRALADETLRPGAFFLWTDNGEPISNGVNGQKHLSTPGKHVIEVLMTTAKGREYRARRTVTVLDRVSETGGG